MVDYKAKQAKQKAAEGAAADNQVGKKRPANAPAEKGGAKGGKAATPAKGGKAADAKKGAKGGKAAAAGNKSAGK